MSNNNKKYSRGCLSVSVVVTLSIVVGLVVLQQFLFQGVLAPPSDHGTGNMFDIIAKRYDLINRVMAMGLDVGWRLRLVAAVKDRLIEYNNNDKPAKHYLLDVATGTADVALLLASQIPTAAAIVGVDPSNKMLAIGRDKINKKALDERITLIQGDARTLQSTIESYNHNNLQSQSRFFHAATMAFGIRNVPDRELALCQIHAVLHDQATLAILELSEPDATNVMGYLARAFIRHVVPIIGGLLSGAPREYWHLQASIRDFSAPLDFVKLINNLQCETGRYVVNELVQMNFKSVQLYVATSERNNDNNAASIEMEDVINTDSDKDTDDEMNGHDDNTERIQNANAQTHDDHVKKESSEL